MGQGDGIRERWRTCQDDALELVSRFLLTLVIIVIFGYDVAALSLVLHRGRGRSRSSQGRVRMVVLRPTAAAWARVRARHDAGRGSFGGSVGAARGRARCWRGSNEDAGGSPGDARARGAHALAVLGTLECGHGAVRVQSVSAQGIGAARRPLEGGVRQDSRRREVGVRRLGSRPLGGSTAHHLGRHPRLCLHAFARARPRFDCRRESFHTKIT